MSGLGWLLPLLPLLHHTFAALEVFAPSPQRALVGSNVVLTCTFSVDKGVIEPNILAILWYFQGEVVLMYDNKNMTQKPRIWLSLEAARNGNASISLSNVALSDGGIYKCVVIHSPERVEKEISFDVRAPPVILIPNKAVSINKDNTLCCKVTGFFPPDIAIHWLIDEEVQKQQMMGKPQQNRDGTYWVNSSMVITATDEHRNKTFSCRIQHVSLQEPLQETFQLVYEDEPSNAGTIVGCVITVLLISVVMFGIFWWKQRKNRRKAMEPFTVKEIEGPPQLFHGEEATLCCTATNCTRNVRATWLEKRDGQVREVPQSQPVDAGEEEKLLGASYVIRSQKEGLQYSSSLRFTPYMERHRDVTFICRFLSGHRNEEKTFHCKTIYGKPQLLQPVSRSLFVSGEMKLVLSLEKFYPRKIKMSWTCGVGESQEMISSTETLTENPDGTYNVSSEARIREALLKDPRFRVLANWEHDSPNERGQKELSVRDKEYPWTPVVEKIQTPALYHNTPVTLQCNISEYFPDAVTVKWLRKKDQEICEETDAVYKQNIQSHKDTKNTYSCTATLTIVPTLTVHQGAAYICQVHHPSLETPIETRTGELRVLAKPHMADPIKITADSSRVGFSLTLRTFWPHNINIDWRHETNKQTFPLSPKQALTVHDDCTADVTSECSLPIKVFTDPEVRVHVTWSHEAMEEPETRSLSIRDLQWRLQVGDMTILRLEDKKKASLTCNISGYFPDHLTVTWMKRKDGKMTQLTDLQNKILSYLTKSYTVTNNKKRQKDQSFTLESCLTFTASISSDQGSEFICRVEHPSLEHPQERNTGPLQIGLNRNKEQGVTKNKKLISQQSTIGISPSTSVDELTDQTEMAVEATEHPGEDTLGHDE
ncbi:uncharacterized protein LOC134945848 isoform X1 [Pseudophryne corroboree]|uniref:uncharacterized protein LOC134945848 isoform X1 n=1 Tax=Pseudophryne corroboree TaxID=495146 RepID=UPI0030818312